MNGVQINNTEIQINTLQMTHSQVAYYDATVLGAEVEVEEGKSNDESLFFSYPNSEFVRPATDKQQQQQQQEGSDPCECDSPEGDLIIPIYSVDTDSSPEQNKAKRECSPPSDDGKCIFANNNCCCLRVIYCCVYN